MKKFYITNYNVDYPLNKKIILISDIHYYNKKMKSLLDELYLKISLINADYICIPGDFIDERNVYDEEIFFDFLKKLGDLCPVIISIGNHEAKSKKDDEDKINKSFMNSINKIDNVHLLDNSCWINDNIRFIGLTLPNLAYLEKKDSYKSVLETLDKYFENGIRKDKVNIVLSHSPYTLLYPKVQKHKFYKNVDLILSGHTHAGLTPRWLYNLLKHAFITPQKRLFPNNSYGYLKNEKTIVSSGITKLSHFNPFNYFNFIFNSEIVVINIKK